MTFNNLPASATVFIDANCLVYAATSDPAYGAACQRLLVEVDSKNILGRASSHVLGDMSHRLMTIEAALLFSRPMTGIANWLRRHPAEVKQLTAYQQSVNDLAASSLVVLPVTGAQIVHAAALSRQYGLLNNDALIVAVMQDHGIAHLASNDADFDRVPGITRYAPV